MSLLAVLSLLSFFLFHLGEIILVFLTESGQYFTGAHDFPVLFILDVESPFFLIYLRD